MSLPSKPNALTHFSALRLLRSYSSQLGMLATVSSQALSGTVQQQATRSQSRARPTNSLVIEVVRSSRSTRLSASSE